MAPAIVICIPTLQQEDIQDSSSLKSESRSCSSCKDLQPSVWKAFVLRVACVGPAVCNKDLRFCGRRLLQ